MISIISFNIRKLPDQGFQFVIVLDPKYPEILELLKEFRVVLDAKTAEDTYNPR